jgi:phage shock protein E
LSGVVGAIESTPSTGCFHFLFKLYSYLMGRIFIDVREPSEYEMGHVEGAINLPPSKLLAGADLLKEIPKNTEIILYCLSGSRSNTAMHILKNSGFSNVVNGINKEQVKTKYNL